MTKQYTHMSSVNFYFTSLYTSQQFKVNIPHIPAYHGLKLLAQLFRGIDVGLVIYVLYSTLLGF